MDVTALFLKKKKVILFEKRPVIPTMTIRDTLIGVIRILPIKGKLMKLDGSVYILL
jgi:hypothetical protein